MVDVSIADKQRDAVCALANSADTDFLELAGALYELHANDRSAISKVEEATVLSRRQLYNLMDIGELTSNHAISRDDAMSIGPTKLQIIARHVLDTDDVKSEQLAQMVGLARVAKARVLARALNGANPRNTKAFVFHLNKSETSLLRQTLLQFGARPSENGGLIGKERALRGLVRNYWSDEE